jgi:DNA polymerase III subunit delta
VKLQGRAIEAFVKNPDPKVRAVLVYGPDSGLVNERATAIGRTVVSDLADPFRVAELAPAVLADEPARLADEAAALSFTGGRRLVRVRGATDRAAAAFAGYLAAPIGDGLIVAEADELSAGSTLRKLFEGAEFAAALPCYVEDERDLARFAGEMLREQGLDLTEDAAAFVAQNLVGDRLLARRELEKLATYIGACTGNSRKRVDLDDVMACIGDNAQLSLDDAVLAAADGDLPELDRALRRLWADDLSGVAVLRVAQRHFQKLHVTKARIAAGDRVEAALAQLRPKLFFKVEPRFRRQLDAWPLDRIARALERLMAAETACKRTGAADQTLCSRALYEVARLPGGRRLRAGASAS